MSGNFQVSSNTSDAVMQMFETETITITRRSTGATPGTFTTTTIFTGLADFDANTGATFMGAGGAVMTADAELTIEPVAGVLPAVLVGDLVAYNSQTYTVVQVAAWTFPLKHFSAMLKLGVLTMKPIK